MGKKLFLITPILCYYAIDLMFQFRLETSQRRYLYTAQIVCIVIVEPNLNALPAFLYNTVQFDISFSKIQQMSAGRGLYIRLNIFAEKGRRI